MNLPKKATYTSDQLTKARRNGFKRKKPKQPKRVTESGVRSYLNKWNSWVKELKQRASEYDKRIKARQSGKPTEKQQLRDAMRG